MAVFFGDRDGVPRIQIHRNVNLCRAHAKRVIACALNTVLERHRCFAYVCNLHGHVNLVAVNERREELGLHIDGRKTDALIPHQAVIWNAATGCEEFFKRDMKIMKDARVINKFG